MRKVVFSQDVVVSITSFAKRFHSKNIEMFIDSGIHDEDIIIENYIAFSQEIRNNVEETLLEYFSREIIGKMKGENDVYSVVTYGNFKMFVSFSEDLKQKIRFLESIEFFKK